MSIMNLSGLSEKQAEDEITLLNIKKLLQKARKAQQNAQLLEAAVYKAMEDLNIDLNCPTDAKNAVNLKHVLYKHLHSGSYPLRDVMKEVRMWYCG